MGTFEKQNQKTKAFQRHSVFLAMVFSRRLITVLFALFQIFCLFAMFIWFRNIPFLAYILNILGAAVLIYIVNDEENPAFKLAWVIPICAFPVFGVSLYLFIKMISGNRTLQKRLDYRISQTKPYLQTRPEIIEKLEKGSSDVRQLACYLQNENNMPAYDHTEVSFLELGERMHEDLLKELQKAQKFIFLEFFIINEGKIWRDILTILREKAKEGVEVRVMYDGICAMSKLPFGYPKYLQSMGIKAKMFSPILPILSTTQNNRDHRKILIIDGKVAYNGGINIADEYMNEIVRFGHWKDTAVKIKGEAVQSFTMMFLQMWNLSTGNTEDYERFVSKESRDIKEEGIVIPFNDDPTNRMDIAKEVYLDLINKAERYVHITTPYLVLDNEMITALCLAARKGIEVCLALPHIPDKKIMFATARTYYPKLLEAGVQIYEYTPGFLHAKEIIADDRKAVVGTVNLDFRSMYEHFECATLLCDHPVISQIEKDYEDILEKSQKIDMQFCVDLSFFYRLVGQIGRLIAPLI